MPFLFAFLIGDMEVAKSLAPLAPTASMVPCDVLKTIKRKCRALHCFACDHSSCWVMLLKYRICWFSCLHFCLYWTLTFNTTRMQRAVSICESEIELKLFVLFFPSFRCPFNTGKHCEDVQCCMECRPYSSVWRIKTLRLIEVPIFRATEYGGEIHRNVDRSTSAYSLQKIGYWQWEHGGAVQGGIHPPHLRHRGIHMA